MITDFEQLTRKLRDLNRRVRVAAVCPRDHSSEAALTQAHKEGWAEPIVIDHDDQPTAAREAVAAVRRVGSALRVAHSRNIQSNHGFSSSHRKK